MAPTDQTCRFLSFARNLPFLVIKSCMLTLALERIYATWHYSTYEQSRATLVNVLLTIFAVSWSFFKFKYKFLERRDIDFL